MEDVTRPDLGDFLKGLRRRLPLIATIAACGAVLSLLVAWVLPPVYSSTAKVLVESQQIPTDLARSTVTASVAERLELIEQRLTTRETLLAVADSLEVFGDRPDLTPTEKVELMREAIAIEPIVLGERPRRGPVTVTAFTITYRAHRPGLAAAVANELVTRVLEQNLRQRSARAAETNTFFKNDLERLQGEIAEVEEKIATFKEANKDALPESLTFRREALTAIDSRSFERERRRAALSEQRQLLLDTLQGGLPTEQQSLTPEQREIERLKSTLAQRRAVLAESHPEIRALKASLGALEASEAQGSAAPSGNDGQPSPQELARRRLERQIAVIEDELGLLGRQDDAENERRAALEVSIARTPSVEMDLAGLIRRYEDLKREREVAVVKQAEAATGERLEANRQAERFEVIEQAERPSEPEAPNRPAIALGGGGASILLAIAMAFLLESTNRTIRTPAEMERRLSIRPVVSVPYIRSAAEDHRRRRKRIAIAVALVIGVPAVLYLIDQKAEPLPLLAERIVTITGLDGFLWAIEQRLGL